MCVDVVQCALACLGMHACLLSHALVRSVGAFAIGHILVACDVGAGSELSCLCARTCTRSCAR